MVSADEARSACAQQEGIPCEQMQLAIRGLSCAGDAASLERRLQRIDGIQNVTVNPLTELAYISFAPGRFDLAALVAEIERSGYRTG